MSLYQIHWKFKDGRTEMKAQAEINSHAEMDIWWDDVAKRYPLPEGAQLMVCNEQSKHFVMCGSE